MKRLGERSNLSTLRDKLEAPETPLVKFDNREIFRGRAVLRIDFMLRNIR